MLEKYINIHLQKLRSLTIFEGHISYIGTLFELDCRIGNIILLTRCILCLLPHRDSSVAWKPFDPTRVSWTKKPFRLSVVY